LFGKNVRTLFISGAVVQGEIGGSTDFEQRTEVDFVSSAHVAKLWRKSFADHRQRGLVILVYVQNHFLPSTSSHQSQMGTTSMNRIEAIAIVSASVVLLLVAV
jgi:hypothetical protein